MLFIRCLLFLIGQTVITIVYFPITLIAYFLPAMYKMKLISGWGWLVIKWLKLTCNIDYRLSGLENIPNTQFIGLVKHQSTFETMALLYILPAHCWVLKKELLRIPVFGWGLAMALPIAIDRDQPKAALKQLKAQAKNRIERGLSIVICPEGTRMPPGEAGKYNPGGSMIAVQNQLPILPIAHNAGSFWPRHWFYKYPGMIELVIGEPMDTTDKSVREVNQQAQLWIESTVTKLEAGASGKALLSENAPWRN